ncbi:CCHC-type domain-containing protein [Durusdinium trenchii]|uniref:CCHC-type domain-containing protein n=1 Tax=Durusdinium trenchii TaxID=1381693 RepID=A0ABP0HWU8_9DINO
MWTGDALYSALPSRTESTGGLNTGVQKSKDGVPVWGGEAVCFEEFIEMCLLYEQTVVKEKRYLCGPRIAAELRGPARRVLIGKPANWLSHDGGVRVLVAALRAERGQPKVPEMSELLLKYFRGTKRQRGEPMGDFILRKAEAYTRAQQSMARYQRDHGMASTSTWPASSTAGRHPSSHTRSEPGGESQQGPHEVSSGQGDSEFQDPIEEWDTHYNGWQGYYDWSWYDSYGQSWSRDDRQDTSEWSRHQLPEILPDFIQGWYLFMDSGLDVMERNVLHAELRGEFGVRVVEEVLRKHWSDSDIRKRDAEKGRFLANYSGPDDLEEEWGHMGECDPMSLEAEGFSVDEIEAMVAEEERARSAMTAIQDNRRTLRDARARQHAVKMSRQFYGRPAASGGRDDGNRMSLAELRQRLSQHGEEAPKGWTKAQLKLRLIEIEGEEAMLPQAKEVSPLRQMEVNINKASGADLQKFVKEEMGVDITGMETVEILKMKALNRAYNSIPVGHIETPPMPEKKGTQTKTSGYQPGAASSSPQSGSASSAPLTPEQGEEVKAMLQNLMVTVKNLSDDMVQVKQSSKEAKRRTRHAEDVELDVVPAEAHWGISQVERAIQCTKHIMTKLALAEPEISPEEALSEAVRVENEREVVRGYSPAQHALGRSPDAHGRFGSEVGPIDHETLCENPEGEFQRNQERMRTAEQAFTDFVYDDRITRAKNTRSYAPQRFLPGDLVFVWRIQGLTKGPAASSRSGGYTGPCRVLAVETRMTEEGNYHPGSVVWLVRAGRLIKANVTQLRHASAREETLEAITNPNPVLPWTFTQLTTDLGINSFDDVSGEVPEPMEIEQGFICRVFLGFQPSGSGNWNRSS